MVYTDYIILTALTNLNLIKATSWNFIPEKAYDLLLKNNSLIPLQMNFINKTIAAGIIPGTIALARLFCLDKTLATLELRKISDQYLFQGL